MTASAPGRPEGAKTASRLPIEPGESVLWTLFGSPARQRGAAWPLSERIAPTLHLLLRTDRRLFAVRTSLLGAPVDDVMCFRVRGERAGSSDALVVRAEGATYPFKVPQLGTGDILPELEADGPSFLCYRCMTPSGACPHATPRPLRAAILTALLPGLGQLDQHRAAPAILLMAPAVAALASAVTRFLGPRGDRGAWSYQRPALLYLAILAVALADALLHARRVRRRDARRP